MKTILITFLGCLLAFSSLEAQQYKQAKRTFGKGQTEIQIGAGVVPTTRVLDGAELNVLPLSVAVEHYFGKNFSLGAMYNYASSVGKQIISSDGISHRVVNNTHQVGLKTAFHVTRIDNVDLYGGMLISANFQRFSAEEGSLDYLVEHRGVTPEKTKLSYTAVVGGRYAFTNRLSAFGEFGFGASLLTVGVGFQI